MKRLILAFLVTALAYPLIIFIGGGEYRIFGTLAVASFTFPITLLIGLPFFLYFRYKGWLEWWQVALGGLGIGVLCSLISLGDLRAFLFMSVVFGTVGMLHTLLFWAIGIWDNPAPVLRAASASPEQGKSP